MLKDAPIIILDEATSSVDPENEDELQRAIEALTHDKTIIMIAHRLKTVRNADQILVLDNAHIVQRGTHAELIQQKGLYADFVSARQAIGWKLAFSKGGSDETSCVRGGLSGNHPCSPKETRHGALRRCGPAHGGVKAQRVPCSGYLAGWRLSHNGRRSLLHLTDVAARLPKKSTSVTAFFTEQLIAAGVDPRKLRRPTPAGLNTSSAMRVFRLKEAAVQEQD